MENINKVIITGNMTRDPELRSTAWGVAIMGFGIASNDSRKNQQTGEWEDKPNFIDCTMFGKRAESISRYLSKGTHVTIEGKLCWSQWEKDGQKRSKIEIIVEEIEWNDRRESQQAPYQAQAYQQGYAPQPYQHVPAQGYQTPQSAPYPAQAPYPAHAQQTAPQPAPYQAQPPLAAPMAAPVVDASSSVYDEDIPF